MRLPRRVPWRSLQELDEVCSWIYSESATHETKLRAINRVRGSCSQSNNLQIDSTQRAFG